MTCGMLLTACVVFNLGMHEWNHPPNLWYNMTKQKCLNIASHSWHRGIAEGAQNLGMKSTFFESAILACIPTMVFATGFALLLDRDGDML